MLLIYIIVKAERFDFYNIGIFVTIVIVELLLILNVNRLYLCSKCKVKLCEFLYTGEPGFIRYS